MIYYEYDIDRYDRWPLLFSAIKHSSFRGQILSSEAFNFRVIKTAGKWI